MYDEISRNKRRTVLLLGLMTLLLALVSGLPLSMTHLGRAGWFVGVGAAVVVVAIAYRMSGWLALTLGGARPTRREDYPRLYNLVEGLCIAGGVPMPRIYVVEDDAPNAFASGRNPRSAAIAVTTGLLARMNRVELEGVLAHELAHIRNYDTLVTTAAVVFAGAVNLVSNTLLSGPSDSGRRHHHQNNSRDNGGFGAGSLILSIVGLVLLLLAPIMAQLLRFAISRNREMLADVSAADLTRYPPGLVSALKKVRDAQTAPGSGRTSSDAIAHMWFSAPTDGTGRRGRWSARWTRLNATHPPIEERIAALSRL